MKKKKVLAILLSLALVIGAVGCGSKEKPKDETPPKEETVYTEKEIQDVIAGIEDHYVLQDAKGIDYLHNVSYDADIVEEVTVDSKKIKVEKPGTYQALYTVKINKKALEDYLTVVLFISIKLICGTKSKYPIITFVVPMHPSENSKFLSIAAKSSSIL